MRSCVQLITVRLSGHCQQIQRLHACQSYSEASMISNQPKPSEPEAQTKCAWAPHLGCLCQPSVVARGKWEFRIEASQSLLRRMSENPNTTSAHLQSASRLYCGTFCAPELWGTGTIVCTLAMCIAVRLPFVSQYASPLYRNTLGQILVVGVHQDVPHLQREDLCPKIRKVDEPDVHKIFLTKERTFFRVALVRFGLVTVCARDGSNGSSFRFRWFLWEKGFSVFPYSVNRGVRFRCGCHSWKMVPTVPVLLLRFWKNSSDSSGFRFLCGSWTILFCHIEFRPIFSPD